MVYALLDPIKEKKLLEADPAVSYRSNLDLSGVTEAHRHEDEDNSTSIQLNYDWYNTVIYGLPNLILN